MMARIRVVLDEELCDSHIYRSRHLIQGDACYYRGKESEGEIDKLDLVWKRTTFYQAFRT